MNPIAVNLARADAVNRDVPVVPGAVLRGVEPDDVGRLGIGCVVEQHELDRGGMFRIDAEVNTLGANRSANRIRSPGGGAKHRPCCPPYSYSSETTSAVQPVWWLAPSPAPVSPLKYS